MFGNRDIVWRAVFGGPVENGAVVLTNPADWQLWLTAPALCLQRPLPDGALQTVAEGLREDAA